MQSNQVIILKNDKREKIIIYSVSSILTIPRDNQINCQEIIFIWELIFET